MNPKNTVRILAAVVDTRQLTLYKEDGSTIIIPQGDPMLRRIIEQATPQLVEKRWADVDLEIPPENSYDDFQKKSSGLVRFFKVAKEKLKSLFTPVPEMVLGEVPLLEGDTSGRLAAVVEADRTKLTAMDHIEAGIADAEKIMSPTPLPTVQKEDGDHVPVEVQIKHEQTMAAVNDIIAHATPVSSEDFHERDVAKQGRIAEKDGSTIARHDDNSEPDTIIAVVDNKIIPGMEKIKTQFGRAVTMGSTIGVENFLRRLASVIDNRGHSVEDLLKFLERADLPIAEDGTILIYKLLNRKGDGKYVDCHSGKVEQFVGAFVCMDPSLVDPNRSRDCSNGLHVARRGYLSSFSGNVCVLAKLAPEDVIAVPQYDANKMRVCGYHIIAELNQAQFNAVKSNKPITFDEAGRTLLAKAIAGDHIRRTHEVRVTGAKGSSLITTEIAPDVKPPVAEPAESAPETVPLTMADVPAQLISDAAEATELFGDDELERFRDEQIAKGDVSHGLPAKPEEAAVSDVQARVYPILAEHLGVNEGTIALTDNLRDDLGTDSLDDVELVMMIEDEFDIEIPDEDAEKVKTVGQIISYVEDRLGMPPAAPVPEPVPTPAPAPLVEALSDPAGLAMDQPTDPKEVLQVVEKATAKVALSRKEQAAALYEAFERGDIGSLDALIAFKKSAKKGWDVLGIPDPTAKAKEKAPKVFEKKANPPPKVFDVPAVKTPAPSAGIIADVAGEGSPKQRISKLLAIGLDSAGIAASVLAIKKAAKKSWEILGVTPAQVDEILKQTGKK